MFHTFLIKTRNLKDVLGGLQGNETRFADKYEKHTTEKEQLGSFLEPHSQYFRNKNNVKTNPGMASVTGFCFRCISHGTGTTKVTLGSSKSEPNIKGLFKNTLWETNGNRRKEQL